MTDPHAVRALSHVTSPVRVAIAWLIVGVPAVWGISQTAMQAAALFRAAPPVETPTPTTQPAKSVQTSPGWHGQRYAFARAER